MLFCGPGRLPAWPPTSRFCVDHTTLAVVVSPQSPVIRWQFTRTGRWQAWPERRTRVADRQPWPFPDPEWIDWATAEQTTQNPDRFPWHRAVPGADLLAARVPGLAAYAAEMCRSLVSIKNELRAQRPMLRRDKCRRLDSPSGQLLHHQADGAPPDPPRTREGFPTQKGNGGRMGRRLPRQPHLQTATATRLSCRPIEIVPVPAARFHLGEVKNAGISPPARRDVFTTYRPSRFS